jgi:hypothetical protein
MLQKDVLRIPMLLVGTDEDIIISYVLKRGKFKIFMYPKNFKMKATEIGSLPTQVDTDILFDILSIVYEENHFKFLETDQLFEAVKQLNKDFQIPLTSHDSFGICYDGLDKAWLFSKFKIKSTYDNTIEEEILTKAPTVREALVKGILSYFKL